VFVWYYFCRVCIIQLFHTPKKEMILITLVVFNLPPPLSLSPLSPLHPISYLINEMISLSLWNERTNSTMGCCTHDPIMGIRRGTTIPILHLGNTHGRCYQGHALSSLLASVLIICCTIPHRHFRRAKCIP